MIIDLLSNTNVVPPPKNDYKILFGEGDTNAKIEKFTSEFNVFTCYPEWHPQGREYLKRTLHHLPNTHIVVLVNFDIKEQVQLFENIFENKVAFCKRNRHGHAPPYNVIKKILIPNGIHDPNFFLQESVFLTRESFDKMLLNPQTLMLPTRFSISFKNINSLYTSLLLLIQDFLDIYECYKNYLHIRLNQLQRNERNLCNLLSLFVSFYYTIKIIVNYGLIPSFSIKNGVLSLLFINQ